MPNINKLREDKILQQVVVEYRSDMYIADEVFKPIAVQKISDKYRIYQRDFRIPETKRAPGGLAREKKLDVTTGSYLLEKHAQKGYVTKEEKENFEPGNIRASEAQNLMDIIMRRKEFSVADLIMTSTSWSLGVSFAATGVWSANTTVSNPIPSWDTAGSVVLANSGKMINTGIMARTPFVNCKNHVSVLDRVKYTSAEVDTKMIASLFGVEKILIGTAQYDSSQPGLTEVITDIWNSDQALALYVAPNAGPRAMSAGYTFQKGMPTVKTWIDEERDDAEAIEVQLEFDPVITAAYCGYHFNNVS